MVFNFNLNATSLGEEHVSYKRLDFPTLKLGVVGCGQPFFVVASSCSGKIFFLQDSGDKVVSCLFLFGLPRYGFKDTDGSAKRIYNAAMGNGGHLIIFLLHNGPTDFCSNVSDIYGKDQC